MFAESHCGGRKVNLNVESKAEFIGKIRRHNFIDIPGVSRQASFSTTMKRFFPI